MSDDARAVVAMVLLARLVGWLHARDSTAEDLSAAAVALAHVMPPPARFDVASMIG